MTEMDLIPQDYRRQQQLTRGMRNFVIAAIAMLLCSTAIYGAFAYLIREDHKAIVVLEKKKAISSQQRQVLEALQSQHKNLADRLAVLERLRGGAAAQDMFVAVDRALEGDSVWFTAWSFRRAGSAVPRQPQTVNTGYFIVIPRGEGPSPESDWQIQTHMEVRGQARDHAALSTFVSRLLSQPQIGDVRVLNTQRRKYTQTTVVDFQLAIVVDSNRSGA